MQHLIKKQIIHLTLPKQAGAFRLQQQVSNYCQKELLQLMAEVFDELSDEDAMIKVERLEIDLGILSEQEIDQGRWDSGILSTIRDQLYEKISNEKNDSHIKREELKLSICSQWLFYMQKGYLPWNIFHITGAWYDKVLEALAVDYATVSEVRAMIQRNPDVSRRIVLQHDEKFLVSLVEVLTGIGQQGLPAMIAALIKLLRLKPAGQQWTLQGEEKIKQIIWQQSVQLVASEGKKTSATAVIEKVMMRYISPADIGAILSAGDLSSFTLLLPALKNMQNKIQTPDEDTLRTEEGRQVQVEDNAAEGKAGEESDGIDEEGIFVQAAGIVLIHSFLASLFSRLLLTKDNKFPDKEAQQKAIALLHYIATGAVSAREYELTVPKLLCEWPLEMPTEKYTALAEDQLQEADNMLQAVIEHWTVLKSTPVSGLREGFLQRKGKLFTKNNNLYLQIEANSIDVLLDQLPWSVSIIKLPWMKKMLRVEWR